MENAHINIESSNVGHYFRIRKHVTEMLFDRGYDIKNDFDTIEKFSEHFMTKSITDLNLQCSKESTVNTCVFFVGKSMNKSEFSSYCTTMNDLHCNKSIIVYNGNLNHAVKNAVAEINNKEEHSIQLFSENDLLMNVTHHYLVPKHILLSEDEKNEVLKKKYFSVKVKVQLIRESFFSQAKESQFPKIKVTDPIAKYFDAKRGQMFQIIRIYDDNERYDAYRIVV